MREIKFRAWTGNKYLNEVNISKYGFVMIMDSGEYVGQADYEIEQYTGLKDKHGKEIYEGDIVVIRYEYPFFDDGEPNYIAVVEWVFAGWQTVLNCVNDNKRGISDGINEGYLEESENYEIIGNIHENPELLKQ